MEIKTKPVQECIDALFSAIDDVKEGYNLSASNSEIAFKSVFDLIEMLQQGTNPEITQYNYDTIEDIASIDIINVPTVAREALRVADFNLWGFDV